MKILDDYLSLQSLIFSYFGYEENWKVIPIDDAREYFWRINGSEAAGEVQFSNLEENVGTDEGYSNEIYTQRYLPKWVYRGEEYTMICVDTNIDGNKFLQIFDNSKERPL